jgi:hypothetical protein
MLTKDVESRKNTKKLNLKKLKKTAAALVLLTVIQPTVNKPS